MSKLKIVLRRIRKFLRIWTIESNHLGNFTSKKKLSWKEQRKTVKFRFLIFPEVGDEIERQLLKNSERDQIQTEAVNKKEVPKKKKKKELSLAEWVLELNEKVAKNKYYPGPSSELGIEKKNNIRLRIKEGKPKPANKNFKKNQIF